MKNILNELAQIEYSSSGIKTILSSNTIENKILKTILQAISTNSKLSKMFNIQDDIYDFEVEKIGSIVKITMNPENGLKKDIGSFPLMYISKYIDKPKEMASFLLSNYQDSILVNTPSPIS